MAVPAAGLGGFESPGDYATFKFQPTSRHDHRAAFMYTMIVSCKMNDIDPQAWMADVLARLPDITVSRLPELLPWNWKVEQKAAKAA